MKQVLGYCVPWSVAPGEAVEVKVSVADGSAYESQLLRVICADPMPGGAGMDLRPVPHASNGHHPGRHQTHSVGSCVVVPSSARFDDLPAFTLQCFVQPTLAPGRPQAILSRWSEATGRGFALEIDPRGHLSVCIGDGASVSRLAAPEPLGLRAWWFVWARFDAASAKLEVGQSPVAPRLGPDRACAAEAATACAAIAGNRLPLLMAAQPDAAGGVWHSAHFNGKLDRPRLCGRWLSDAERDGLAIDLDAVAPSAAEGLIAAWDLAGAQGGDIGSDHVHDLGPHGLHARTVNLPSRGVKGHNWRGDSQSWQQAPQQYAAIHFHDDDLYDAGWATDFVLPVPHDLPSGYYALRLRSGGDESCIPLFVRPPRGTATAPVAFLASTATYIAYANYRFQLSSEYTEALLGHTLRLGPAQMHVLRNRDVGLSTYDIHSDGSGVRHASRLRPMLNAGPGSDLWNYAADTHLLHWLDHIGQAVDVITDEDLHAEGQALLSRYRCVITGSHPEYWTTPMWQGLQSWLAAGGRLMYLGGNGFYWRTAMHAQWPGAIEVRRAEGGSRYWAEEPGEYHFAFTGEYAGLTRRTGLSPHALVGVATRAIGFQSPGWYERLPASQDPRAAFIFDGIDDDERIGDFGVLGAAAGSEVDAADTAHGTPRHALVLAASQGHGRDMLAVAEDVLMLNPGISAEHNPRLRAEMVFFETAAGGAVFSVGSIQWAASLPHNGGDNNVARLSANVLARFVDPRAFTIGRYQETPDAPIP
jgi:N,N-dimethylformamidase